MHSGTRLGIVIAGLAAAAAFVIFHPALRSRHSMPPIPPSQTGSVSDAMSAADAAPDQPPLPPGQTHSVDDRLRQFGTIVRGRLEADFRRAGISWPSAAITLIGLKQERLLEVHAAGPDGTFRFIRAYPILAASGTAGPKLREGDRQVPEGLYRIESLNPNSLFHLALRVNYPNEFDRAKAAEEGRSDPGCDIMIHGGAASIGCLAMGDEAAEDLFVIAALAGLPNLTVILSPIDFRSHAAPPAPADAPTWTPELYESIKSALRAYRKSS